MLCMHVGLSISLLEWAMHSFCEGTLAVKVFTRDKEAKSEAVGSIWNFHCKRPTGADSKFSVI